MWLQVIPRPYLCWRRVASPELFPNYSKYSWWKRWLWDLAEISASSGCTVSWKKTVSFLAGSTSQPNITHLYCTHSHPQPYLEVCRDHKRQQCNSILTFVSKLFQTNCWTYQKSKILLSIPQVHSNEICFEVVKCKICPCVFMCVRVFSLSICNKMPNAYTICICIRT